MKLNLSCIEEGELIQKILHQQFFDARIYWHWFLKNTNDYDTKEFTIKFLSLFFKAKINQEWFDCLNFLWNDIQQQWPEPEDSRKIIIQAIDGSELDAIRKDTVLSSLLKLTVDRDLIRACYRIAPEDSESEFVALTKMRQNLISFATNSLTKEIKKDSHLQLIYTLVDDFPPKNSFFLNKHELMESSTIFSNLNRSIQDKYTYFMLFLKCYSALNHLKKHGNLKKQNFNKFDEIFSRYNIHPENPLDGLQFLKKLHETVSRENKKHSDILNSINNIKLEITNLIEKYQFFVDADLPAISDSQKRPFGYVDKPIERFLAYCDDISCEIVLQCIFLYISKSQRKLILHDKTLPFWIHEEFDKWWEDQLSRIRIDSSSPTTHRSPFLSLNNRFDQIQIVIPEQSFEKRGGLDHIDLVLCDDAEIITEEKLPLYFENENVISHEIRFNLPSPSSFYTVDLTDDLKNRHWKIDAFDNERSYLLFDYYSLRLIEKGSVPSKQFLLLTKEKISISPKSSILETGQLFGGWKDFSYFIINPEEGKRVIIGESFDERTPPLQDLKIVLDQELFEKNIFLNDQKVIIGKSPKLLISFNNPETLFKTVLSIHPGEQSSLEKPLYCDFEEIHQILNIKESENVCEIDLGEAILLGENPVGFFIIRIRNELCRFDTRFECVCIPDLRLTYSKKFFLPQKTTKNLVKIRVQSRNLIHFEPGGPEIIEKRNDGFVISSYLQQRIEGTLSYRFNDDKMFIASLSIFIPQLAWRFENESKGMVWPIQRSVVGISENEYESFGENPTISIFLPESFKGQGVLSMDPQNQYVIKNIVNGRGSFPLDRFNDTLRVSDAEITYFQFSMDLSNGELIRCPLFEIKRWIVRLHTPIEIVSDDEGDRSLEISWTESFQVSGRFIVIWKLGRAEARASKIYEVQVNKKDRHTKINFKKGQVSSGIYYLHFIRKSDEWDSTPIVFPGEKALNIFQFTIEIAGEELLGEADEYFEKGKYLEAINRYRDLESQNRDLVGIWKQKIMNRLIYPRNIPGSLACINEIIEQDSDIKETDFAFFAFIIKNNILDRPHLLNKILCQWIIQILNTILLSKFSIPKKIICSQLNEIERAFHSIENISDHERGELIPILIPIKDLCKAKESKRPQKEVKFLKKKRKRR